LSIKEAIATKAIEVGGKLTVRSALNPILWLCGIITIPSLVCYSFLPNPPSWLIWLAFSPVVAAIVGFMYLLLADPDKLQSENFQLRKMELEMIEEKGSPPILLPESVDGEVISNPEDPTLLTEGEQPEQ
jgi:hypothetical protein